ncbi:uncharacterized protein LOC144198762 [Stigmatopora nigra]
MEVLSFMRAHFNDSVDCAIDQLLQMQPTSFSEQEQHMYNVEKTYMRQFMLLEKENRVPSDISAETMKQWLLSKRNFQDEFCRFKTTVGPDMFALLHTGWMRARQLCLNQIHTQLCEDFFQEEHLSQLFNRKVTLEGLREYLCTVTPLAEMDIKTFLHDLNLNLQRCLSTTEMAETKRLTLDSDFHLATAPIVGKILKSALRSLFAKLNMTGNEEPMTATFQLRSVCASKKIASMITKAVLSIPCIRQDISRDNVLDTCTAIAGEIIRKLFSNLLKTSAKYPLLSWDGTFLDVRREVKFAIEEMVDIGPDILL